MNKIKVLYDIAKAMRTEEKHQGKMSLELKENDNVILNVNGSMSNGDTEDEVVHELKAKGEFAGKKIDHQSRTVSNLDSHGCRKHMMHRKGMKCHHSHEHYTMMNMGDESSNFKPNKMDKFLFGLDMLNKLEIKDAEGVKLLSLNLKAEDMPEYFELMMKHKAMHKMMHVSHGHNHNEEFMSIMEKYQNLKIEDISVGIKITSENKPESIRINVLGKADNDKLNLEFNMERL